MADDKKNIKTFEYEEGFPTPQGEVVEQGEVEEMKEERGKISKERMVSEAKAKEYFGYSDEEFNDRSENDKKRIRGEVFRALEKEEVEEVSDDINLEWGVLYTFNMYK